MARQEGVDYTQLAGDLDEVREAFRALVAGLVADGFTDREAREIIAGMFRRMGPEDKDGDD